MPQKPGEVEGLLYDEITKILRVKSQNNEYKIYLESMESKSPLKFFKLIKQFKCNQNTPGDS